MEEWKGRVFVDCVTSGLWACDWYAWNPLTIFDAEDIIHMDVYENSWP
jgi:hypothetical protein